MTIFFPKAHNRGPSITMDQLAALKAERKARGWTAKDLGRQMGVTAECVNRLERGGAMRYETLLIWAKALGLAVAVDLVKRA